MLGHAGNQQIKISAVRKCLHERKYLAFDALDKSATEVLQLNLKNLSKNDVNQVLNFVPFASSSLSLIDEMRSELTMIEEKLEGIILGRNHLRFVEGDGVCLTNGLEISQMSCLMPESVELMEQVEKNTIGFNFSDEVVKNIDGVCVVSIMGIGGIGKSISNLNLEIIIKNTE